MGQTRRNFLKSAAAAAGGLAIGGQTVVATKVLEDQFLVDTRSADSDAWRENVEIIEETKHIGFASVVGSEEALEGLQYAPEIKYELRPPTRPEGAPATEAAPDAPEATDGTDDLSFTSDGIPEPHPLQWDKKAQGVHDLHQQGITGDGATIAVVDSGIDSDHPDLADNVVYAENFSTADDTGPVGGEDGEYHGTHVAGIAAASGQNAESGDYWAVGIAPEADLMDMKIFPFKSSASTLLAVETAIDEGADVVNMSFGPGSPAGPTVDTHLSQEAYQRLGERAAENGAILVESAGNDDANIDEFTGTLTNAGAGPTEGFLKVSATGPGTTSESIPEFGNVAPETAPSYFTNHGPDTIDLSAEGGNSLFSNYDAVFSTMPPNVPGGFARDGDEGAYGGYGNIHGTSMSAPNVAGAVALIVGDNPEATPEQVRNHLKNTAESITEAPPDIFDLGGVDLGYFESTNSTVYADFELEEPYSSAMYRGSGHLDVQEAATKGIPDVLEGGIEVMGETYYPTDPDNDGLYEDVNGDGVVDMDDVELLYQIALRGVVSEDAEVFDFNDDFEFNMYDVQALLREVESQ